MALQPSVSPFLTLAQEIRDLIFAYAVSEDAYSARDVRDSTNYRTKRIPIGTSDRWQWEAHHTAQAPIPEYLCLMLVNRQLSHEIHTFLNLTSRPVEPIKITLLLEYPKLFTTFTSIPQPPRKTRDMEMLIRVDHIFHPAYISRGSQNALLTAVSDTLKRYIHRGPHLARPSTLRERLHIETVRITFASRDPFNQMPDDYGLGAPQMGNLFDNFMALLRRFCRSGLPWGAIDAFEVRMVGKAWERVHVTSNIWDEEDFIFFQYGGFNWDSGDTTVIQPDMVAW